MNEGWIKVHRQLVESSVFASEKRLKIWIWLLCKANFKQRHVPITIGKGQTVITIERGQILFGRHKAEEELHIDGSTIYKILQAFAKDKMITLKSNSHYTIVSVNNYDTFQSIENEEVTAEEQPSNNQVTAKEQPSNTPKKEKNVNNDNNFYSTEIKEKYQKLINYIEEYAPKVLKMEEPLSIKQFLKLEKDGYFSKQYEPIVLEKLKAMHNCKDLLKKYTSANSTLRSWTNKEIKK